MFRFLALGAFLSLLFAPAAMRAAEPAAAQSDSPTFVLQVQSVGQLLDNAEYLAGLAGKQDQAKQYLGWLKALAGDKGIEKGIAGVDTQKPFLIYGCLDQQILNSELVVMAPIADQKAFLGLLQQTLALKVTDEKDGLFSTDAPNNMGTIYFRFANDYVYAAYLTKKNVDAAKVRKPADIANKGDSVLSLSVRIDQVPEEIKKFALGAFEENLAKQKLEAIPNETPQIKALRDKAIDSTVAGFKSVVFEGRKVTFNVDVDSKKDLISVDVDLTAKKGSALAQDLADFKSRKSVAFGALAAGHAAMTMGLNLSAPEAVKKKLGPAIDDVVKMGLDVIPGEFQKLLEPLVKAFVPTLKAGEFDGSLALVGPDKANLYTVVMSGKIAAGKDLEKSIKEFVATSAEMIPLDSILELDAATIGDAKIHRVKAKENLDDETRKIVGESDLWFAFRDDAFIAAMGPSAKEALKQALTSAPIAGPVMKFELSVGHLLALLAAKNEKATKLAAKKAFGGDLTGDTLSFSVETGDSFHARLAVKGKVLRFVYEMEEAKKAEAEKAK